jgi:hypothetical protein
MARQPSHPADMRETNESRVGSVRDAQDEANAKRRRLVERLKLAKAAADEQRQVIERAREAQRSRFTSINVADAIAAAKRLKFIELEADSARQDVFLNRPTLALLSLFLKVLVERTSVAVLQWPRGARDISVLHPLAALAALTSSQTHQTDGFQWCPPVPDFRTLYFPWRGASTGANQRRILVERTEVLKRNQPHLTRKSVGHIELSEELHKLHITLAHLCNLKQRDTTKPHLAHPTLGELYPTFGALGGEDAPRPFNAALYELFGRVAHGAALSKQLDYRALLSVPSTAPFAFFGICPRSNVKGALQLPVLTKNRQPDVCILDLGPPGMSRLGPDWENAVEEFIELLRRHHSETPVFSITQDIFVHRRLVFLFGKLGLTKGRSSEPQSSRILVRSTEDCFSSDAEIGLVTDIAIHFHSAGGAGAAALRALSEAARKADPSTGGAIRRCMGNVRRAMSLPCGIGTAHSALSDVDAGAGAFLERRSAGTILVVIRRQLELTTDSGERHRLLDAEKAVNSAFNELEEDTPIGSMLGEIAVSLSRKSSPSVIAFATDYELALGRLRLRLDGEQGEKLNERIEAGFIRLVTLQNLDSELGQIESGKTRNSWKRLVVVAPPRDAFAILLGRRWLPEEISVVADREFVDRIGATYASLATHPDLAGDGRIGSRLAKAAAAAKAEAHARDVGPVDLDIEVRGPVIVDESIIDLTSSEDDGEKDVVDFVLESGRTMRVRPGSLVIRYNRLADINPFERAVARDIKPEDTVVVPDQAFVDEARTVLPVRILAQARVKMFHVAVESAYPSLPGDTRAAKARYVIKRMKALGARDRGEETVRNWLNATEHKLQSDDKLRPHAPQHWREFRAFMEVIHMPEAVAASIWREGVEPLRIDRRRAGARMAQAFVSVLVDSHGATAAMPPDVRESIARLRRQATEHLDGVIAVHKQREVYEGELA